MWISRLASGADAAGRRPNVLIILTDDQGFAELGVTGNPIVHTPAIDHFASQSVYLTNYHVMPVCSPTRSCLMTGRYNYRTGVVDTFIGRSMMHPDETTIAQMLSEAGYRTGIFGKWHLGDNFPMRAMDRGFEESLVLNGGGLDQPGDSPDPVDERGAYFNANLRHNGVWEKTHGYVSDVLTDATIKFIEDNRDWPFFAYLPFNCPHSPHQVPEEYRKRYENMHLGPESFPKQGHPMTGKFSPDDIARVYGMIENIDDNVARLLAKLDELKLADNTIVLLFSDNGCQQHFGYNGGFKGWKGTTYEGGIHQFLFARWPGEFKAGRKVDRISAAIDLTPTLLELCGVAKPEAAKFDGRSLAPLLRGDKVEWPDRTLFFQWHRGDVPHRYRAFAARSQDWKLVQPLGVPEQWNGKMQYHLYDMAHDPLEMHDLADQRPDMVVKLKAEYDAWFSDVTSARDYTIPSRIFIGDAHENPSLLTRQDWRGPAAGSQPKAIGHWYVKVVADARYQVKILFAPPKSDTQARFTCGDVTAVLPVKAGQDSCTFESVHLPAGDAIIGAQLDDEDKPQGVKYIEVKRLEG
jgi:arylsulfatase A-like enzyme